MNKNELNLLLEQCFNFIKIPKRKQKRILDILSLCKEIRDTAYPMKGSNVTNLKIKEFNAVKEKDMYSINGILLLKDDAKEEERSFEAYIIENIEETKVYMDIKRLNVKDKVKLIRTSEIITENDCATTVATNYQDALNNKTIFFEIPKYDEINNLQLEISNLNF